MKVRPNAENLNDMTVFQQICSSDLPALLLDCVPTLPPGLDGSEPDCETASCFTL